MHQGQTDSTAECRGDEQSLAHGTFRHPPHRTGTLWAKSRCRIVVATLEIEIVVDEIGINLHDKRKEKAQHTRQPRYRPAMISYRQCRTNHHRHSSSRQCLGACGQQPGTKGIGFYVIFFYHLLICI